MKLTAGTRRKKTVRMAAERGYWWWLLLERRRYEDGDTTEIGSTVAVGDEAVKMLTIGGGMAPKLVLGN